MEDWWKRHRTQGVNVQCIHKFLCALDATWILLGWSPAPAPLPSYTSTHHPLLDDSCLTPGHYLISVH